MKIAVNTRLLLVNRMEGIARFIYETTKQMVLMNPSVEFHFFFDRAYDPSFIFADNVTGHVLSPQSRHPILWYLWFEHTVPKYLKKLDIDVFYSGDMYLSLKTNVPTVLVSHDLNYIHYPEGLKWSHLKFLKYYFPKYHNAADHIITVSNFTKQDVIKQYGISGDRITVAHNAIPEHFREISKKEKGDFKVKHTGGQEFFIYIGSLHPRKNLGRLLLAFEKFKISKPSDIKLILFGRLAFKNSGLFETYNTLKFKEDIIFLDDTTADIALALGSAIGLCYISLFEGFGIPILESFKAGVPVITSNVSSMPEVAGDSALLVNPLDIGDIAEAMLSLAQDSDLRTKLIEKGKIRVQEFSWEKSASTIFKVLKSVSNH